MHLLIEQTRLTKSAARQRFGDSSLVYEDLLKHGLFRDNNADSGTINFVGVGISSGHAIKFAPKIFRNQDPPTNTQFRLLIRTLKKYAKALTVNHPDAQFLCLNAAESSVSQLARADWLIADYLSKGLYRVKPNTQIKQGAPTIDWVKTISRTNVTMSNGRPVYLNPIGRTNQADNSHIVSRLHRYVVETCFATYAPLLGFTSQTLDHEIAIPLGKLPEPTVLERVLRQELHQCYSDREVRLLKMLIVWFREEQASSSRQFKPYGVCNFWAVWEAVCKLIFHDEVADWRTKIPAPLWSNASGESQHAGGKWLPDVVMSVRNPVNVDTLFILDAKYYDVSLPPHLSGEPGVGDITKQLFYNQVLQPMANHEGYHKIVNCLVFPSIVEEFIQVSGNVDIKGILGGPLFVIYMNVFKALERYLASSPLTQSEKHELTTMCQHVMPAPLG